MATKGELLLARLHALFAEDPLIDEIGLLLAAEDDDEELTAETAFMLAEHKLGVALSAGPLVFRAARTRFHQLNSLLHNGNNADDFKDELLACTRAIVLISADFYTAWNTRKEYVRRGWLEAHREVEFTNLVFSLHPKSIDTWAYQRWLATRLCEELEGDREALDAFFVAQVTVCATLTERTPRNYHAWSFRHWIVSHFDLAQLERELVAMRKWCETHLMDHSGWNHRQHTIRCVLANSTKDGETALKLLLNELAFLSKILAGYPRYEALWCHRRFVIESILSHVPVDLAHDKSVDLLATLIAGVEGDSQPQVDDEKLMAAWERVHSRLASRLIASGVIEDVAVAWKCGRDNRFARRYALWSLHRLDGKLPASEEASKEAMARVTDAMRCCLASDDALLDDLWRSSPALQ